MQDPYRGLGKYGTVGLDLILATLFGYYAGRWIDNRLGAHGWITAFGFCLGVVTGFRMLFQTAEKLRRETEAEDERERKSIIEAAERSSTKPPGDSTPKPPEP